MRKALLISVLLLALMAGVWPAFATPLDELNDLARYMPGDTKVYVSSSIEVGYFDRINALIDQVSGVFPPDTFRNVPTSINEALDDLISEQLDGRTFSEDIRPWLGNSMAIGMLNVGDDSNGPIIAAIAITDRQAALDFITTAATDGEATYTLDEQDGYTLFEAEGDSFFMIFRDDVAILGDYDLLKTTGGLFDGSLYEQESFVNSFSNLAGSDYDGAVYVDVTALAEQEISMAARLDAGMALLRNVGPMAAGGVIRADSLVLDVAQVVNPALHAEMNQPSLDSFKPINPSLFTHIPASAVIVSAENNLKARFDALTAFVEWSVVFDQKYDPEELQETWAQINEVFLELTGLSLDEATGWMTGDYAFFIGLNPELNTSGMMGVMQTFPLDGAVIIEVTDAAAAQNLVVGLQRALELLAARIAESDDDAELTLRTETLADTEAVVAQFRFADLPWAIDIIIAANDDLMVVGTRDAAVTALTGRGQLATDADFSSANAYALENYHSLSYIGTRPLLPLLGLLPDMMQNADASDIAAADQALRDAVELFPGGIISQAVADNEVIHTRIVVRLGSQ